VAAVLAPLAVPSSALAERWLRPVPGDVARGFAYDRAAPFTAGAHRGVDLAAPPGTTVRAACAGRVVHAGAVAGREEVVSVRCAGRRVSYLPLASVAVKGDATLRAGAPIGTVARGHGGLHLGVRAEGDPFGYLDPMALLPASERRFVPALRPTPSRPSTPRPALRPTPSRPSTPRPALRPTPSRLSTPRPALRPTPSRLSTPRPAPRGHTPLAVTSPATASRPLAGRAPSPPAPWPVWLGLGVLLSGAAGSGTIAVRRRVTRSRVRAAPAAQVG
jgi:hypothetical protein